VNIDQKIMGSGKKASLTLKPQNSSDQNETKLDQRVSHGIGQDPIDPYDDMVNIMS